MTATASHNRKPPVSTLIHPNDALFSGEKRFPIINVCEHFAGSEKLITKALELQNKMGGVFDITCDCEDGAPAGREREHAEMIVRVLRLPGGMDPDLFIQQKGPGAYCLARMISPRVDRRTQN